MHPTHPPERLTLGYFVRELQHYLHLDRGLPHTLAQLLRRPGTTLRRYFDGSGRGDYVNPVAYTLMAAAASLLAYGLYRDDFVAWLRVSMAGMPAVAPGQAAFMQRYNDNLFHLTQLTAVNSVTMAIPNGVLLWLLFRGPRFNLAEAFALALYMIGTFLLVHTLLVSPILYTTHAWSFGQWIGLPLQAVVALHLGFGVFGTGVKPAAKILLALGTSFIAWMIAAGLGVLAYTAARG